MTLKMKSLSLAVVQIVASGALSAVAISPAMAQQQVADDTPGVSRVVVTGSYISRADKETPSPVQVMTSEDLKKSGYTTVSDALRDITANGQGTLGQGFNQAFAAGASGVSLRGLTVGATLVLIDGHRMAPYPLSDDGERQFVDISSIPFEAVDHIDILKDGASALYGSDAIAGVVNVVLKKSFTGTSVTAEGGGTQHGGGATRHVSLIKGFGDDAAGKSGYLALEYRHQDQVKLNQRSGEWTRFDWSGQANGQNLSQGAKNDFVPNPVTLTPYLQSTTGSTSQASSFAFLDNRCSFAARNANQCTYANDWAQLQPTSENINILGSFTAALNDNWDLNVKGSVFDSKQQQGRRPSIVPAGSFAGNTAIGPGITPFIANAIPSFTVPASYPGNPFGAPAIVRALVPDVSNRDTDVDSKSYRFVADVTGTMDNWNMAQSAGFTRVETDLVYNGYINNSALYAALNNAANPFKLTGGNSAAVMAQIAPVVTNSVTDTLSFAEVRGSRDVMPLPGGQLSVSLGGSFIHKALNAPDPVEAQNGSVAGLNGAYAVGKENNAAFFTELSAVMGKLEVDGAVRRDHYDTYGNSTTPQLKLKLTPVNGVTVRGTASKGFRAPNAAENGTAGSLFSFNAIRDPALCPDLNPDGTPSTTSPRNVPSQCKFNPTYLQSTSKDLQPEKSKSYTFGLILEPLRDWSTTLDWYKITVDNQIVPAASLASFDPLAYIVRGTPQIVTYADGHVGTSPVGLIQFVNTPYVNGQTTETTGVEFETRYRVKLPDASKLTMGLQWSHTIKYDLTLNGMTYSLAGTHGPSIIGGDTGNPKDRAQLTLSYERGPMTVAWTTNYISSYDVTDPSNGYSDCQSGIAAYNLRWDGDAPSQYCRIASFTYTNLSGTYKINKAWTLNASVTNLFDKAPPVDVQTYGGTGANNSSAGTGSAYNPSLHQIGAIGRAFNVGLNYKF